MKTRLIRYNHNYKQQRIDKSYVNRVDYVFGGGPTDSPGMTLRNKKKVLYIPQNKSKNKRSAPKKKQQVNAAVVPQAKQVPGGPPFHFDGPPIAVHFPPPPPPPAPQVKQAPGAPVAHFPPPPPAPKDPAIPPTKDS